MRNFIKDLVINSQFKGTARALRWDMMRLGARMRSGRMLRRLTAKGPLSTKLHFGSGSRKVQGWLNCDVTQTDVDIDLGCGTLPFPSAYFEAAVAQHVIEHLTLEEELQPLLRDLHRCMKPGGEVWLSCPDMQKVCESYARDKGQGLVLDKQTRWPNYSTHGYYVSHVVNDLFHQTGQHKNLFDFDLLRDVLTKAGFRDVTHEQESSLLARYPEFPPRRDDFHALYVRAVK